MGESCSMISRIALTGKVNAHTLQADESSSGDDSHSVEKLSTAIYGDREVFSSDLTKEGMLGLVRARGHLRLTLGGLVNNEPSPASGLRSRRASAHGRNV